MVDKPDIGNYRPSCKLAHGLVNRLSVIVGYCDLVRDAVVPGSKHEKQLDAIRATAKDMADELNRHQCDLQVLASQIEIKQAKMKSLCHKA